MTSTESVQVVKKANDSSKKSPLKVVSPIIKKYTGHRKGKIKSKIKFPRVLHGRSKQKPFKLQYKTILPKTNAGNVIILEPELLPCALNLLKRRKIEEDIKHDNEILNDQFIEQDVRSLDNLPTKENRCQKPKFIPNNNKKKIKCLKNLEASLELLETSPSAFKEKREQAFAENYLLRVQERLKDNDETIYNQFIDLICNFQINKLSVCDMYKKVKSLFASHNDLIEDFVAFLTPEQAIECGIFMDHLLLTTMLDFLSMIDVYFAKSPQQIRKIHSVLEALASKANITTESVVNTILPLLKGNPVLNDYFVHMLPNMRPPDNFCTDYEEVEYSEISSDVSDEEDIVEIIHLPEVEDQYGSDSCPCKCHMKELNLQNHHCISCSLRFINGKIFIQNGKLLRPAKVVFDDHDINYHRERLAPKLYPKRTKKRHKQSLFKDNLSPTKSCNLSSDEFKSDIEDEEKQGRVKSGILKSPKLIRKKSVSPKYCDKSLSKCIFTESKPELMDGDEKSCKSLELMPFENDEEKILNRNLFKMDGEDQTKRETNEVLLLSSDRNSQFEGSIIESRSFNLPQITFLGKEEEKDKTFVEKYVKISKSQTLCQNKNCATSENLPSIELQRSHSPPVISIPENEDGLFTNSKPILSLLENLDETKTESFNLSKALKKGFELEEPKNNSLILMQNNVDYNLPWKIEEDRIILQTLQVEKNCEETFMKIGESIPNRSVEDIKMRFAELMNMLYEMKAQNR